MERCLKNLINGKYFWKFFFCDAAFFDRYDMTRCPYRKEMAVLGDCGDFHYRMNFHSAWAAKVENSAGRGPFLVSIDFSINRTTRFNKSNFHKRQSIMLLCSI